MANLCPLSDQIIEKSPLWNVRVVQAIIYGLFCTFSSVKQGSRAPNQMLKVILQDPSSTVGSGQDDASWLFIIQLKLET